MNALTPPPSPAVLSVRISAQERAMLEAAAEQARTTISDYVRRKAIEAAELEIMERRNVIIPAEDWEKFEAWMHSPPEDSPGLRKLFATRPVWEE